MFSFFGYFSDKSESKAQPLEKFDDGPLFDYIKEKSGVKTLFDGYSRIFVMDQEAKKPNKIDGNTFLVQKKNGMLTVYWSENGSVNEKSFPAEEMEDLAKLVPGEYSEDLRFIKQIKCACAPFDIKYFNSPLVIGKYKLSTLIAKWLDKGSSKELAKNLYIAFKINEFLEQSEIYSTLNPPLKTELNNRSDFVGLLTAGSVVGVEVYTNSELNRIVERFNKMFGGIALPEELPGYVKTGSGFMGRYSNLHYIIKNLYKQNQIMLSEKEELQNEKEDLQTKATI